MNKLTQTLWKLFLFSFPFSFSFILYEKMSYRFGNFSPWVTGFLFLPELLLILTFILWLVQKAREKGLQSLKPKQFSWGFIIFLLFLLNAGFVTLFQGDLTLFLFFIIRVLEAGMVYMLIRHKLIPHQTLITWLLYGAVFQIILGYIQTRINGSVGLHVIGEPHIGPEVMNVAKTDLADGTKTIRPYGTFLHPNLLGAYLVTVLFLSLAYIKKKALTFWIVLFSVGIYMTGSQAAQLTLLLVAGILLILGLLKKAKHKKLFSLGFFGAFIFANIWIYLESASLIWSRLHFLQLSSIQERLMQNMISLNMFLGNFFGVGLGNFTLQMEEFSQTKLLPWDFQPVHNTYFLILNETGIQGLILLLILIAYLLQGFWKEGIKYFIQDKTKILPLFALITMASFDHLLWTSWIGVVLVGIVVAETVKQ